MQNIHFLASC